MLALAGCLHPPGPSPHAEGSASATEQSDGLLDADAPAAPASPGRRPFAIADGPRPFTGAAPLLLARTIDSAASRPDAPFQAFDAHSLNLVDLDGDGRREIVSLNDNHRAYVIAADSGRVLAELATARPGGDAWGARDINGIAVGDVDGDGQAELAVLNSAATLTVFTLDREASSAQRFPFDVLWQQTVSAVDLDPDFYATHPWYDNGSKGLGADGNPFIVHLRDGQAVVLAQSDGYPAHIAFDANGTVRWSTSWWDGNSGPWAGPFAPDGAIQAVFATDGGHVVAYDVASGVIQWDFDAAAHGAKPGSIPIMPAVLDLRGDGQRSIFVGARVAVDDGSPDWILRQHARSFLLDAAGRVVWDASFPWGNPLLYADPAAVDVNGDGVKDIVALDWNTIGHKPGAWETTGPANLFALDGRTGKALWHRQIDAQWSNTGFAIASFLPGSVQILTEEQRGGQDGLSLIGLDGGRVGWLPLPEPGWAIRRGPALADLDGDGLLEVVLPVSRSATGCPQALDVGCRSGALLVYDTDAPAASALFDNNPRFAD